MAVAQQHQPQEPHFNGGGGAQPPISSTSMAENMNFTSKRQRRPSVRLVEIGDQPAAALTNQWKPINRSSKSRPLTNLSGLNEGKGEKGDANFDNLAIGSWRTKGLNAKRQSKRPRTNWELNELGVGGDEFSRDFEMEGSESPLNEQNPVHSSKDNEKNLQFRATTSVRERIGEDGVGLDGPSDDNGGHSARGWGGEVDGVRAWLNELGLSRYRPVFEFHEVDEEVLPLLTLEDLKDMGIHAVGSRRKMFCAIQKLNKEFS
ncbi:hypothetical protein SOVF_067730 [Spinacia oleracea]|uniref:Uncharacterized protein LOC110784642 n=1 Tax=Spinacia oleracea TaxID=3562 RepID=A0A9R0JRZ0_SPIOL|nr:uncharacterized protein LOC110784642 [Spinacia oleracea]XP_021844796.1 uncharacterized protein LOC110784642 [Spinacia oleracea]XP_056684827.1 uncharacterized protein LOC110784642 [Spinacia oleracea]XP_056684828.1 uncharacterized protein LOC110784642 [Spinacia oleracea]XP_056684829.1 uncharacterized protein LOC110784642 [Spinacia oleracea]KNA18771.1 hypothetical protein SOVF_067730 [Spinacia oleracea]